MQYYHIIWRIEPALIFTHGSLGYAVLSVNYRTGIMYGRAFRMAPKTGWRGGSEYKDVVAGAQYLRSLPYVDVNKIGLWGGSYGGYLTAMGLARRPGCGVRGQPPGHCEQDRWPALLACDSSGGLTHLLASISEPWTRNPMRRNSQAR